MFNLMKAKQIITANKKSIPEMGKFNKIIQHS